VSHNRRDFLKAASVVAISLGGRAMPLQAQGILPGRDVYPRAGDPMLKELTARALDAARAAGATYADVRLTITRVEDIRFPSPSQYYHYQDYETAGVGVRALVNGAWGFASGTLWSPDEAARLGREAAVQAKMNSEGRKRKIDLGAPPPVVTGEWKTPIKRDPIDVPLAEKLEVPWAYLEQASRYNRGARNASIGAGMATRWERREKTFASTDGSFVTQTLYAAKPSFSVGVETPKGKAGRSSDLLQPFAGGFEVVSEARLIDEMPRLVEEALMMVGAERIMPDRYDVVLDARLMTQLVANTIGTASELDRVLGLEANAGGTSYLAPPEQQLGKFALGPGLLNVRANRSRPGGLATVRWDDEGVVPDEYDVIKDGVLVDYHTTRELSSELAPLYRQTGQAGRSHGCAWSDTALNTAMLHAPNVEMRPGADSKTLDDIVAGMKHGLVIHAGAVTVDRQQLNGEINGEMVYEVRNGKRTKFVHSAEGLFRAPELWKSLKAIGGQGTQVWSGASLQKGQPMQECQFGVGAVPALFTKLAVTDRMRKA
jgi:TldD protein